MNEAFQLVGNFEADLPRRNAVVIAVNERFRLNARQIEILSRATPKRDYYCQSRRGNRLFELGLGEVALPSRLRPANPTKR